MAKYYRTSVSDGGDVAAAREFSIRPFTRTATVSLTFAISPAAPPAPVALSKPMHTK
jgi:hypothetical protein